MNLDQFFKEHNKVAIAFSGGVDSAYLLHEAIKSKVDVCAYYVKSQFQPQFEYDDATRLANQLGARLKVIELDILAFDDVIKNSEQRCYYCKQKIFSSIKANAIADGYTTLLDGTNASDSVNERHGMKALKELKVLSPLRICGLTKGDIRQLSKEAGLFTWNKSAYACLATRIKPNEKITQASLEKIEFCEGYMMKLGFDGHRVRVSENNATILIEPSQAELYSIFENQILNEFNNIFDEIKSSSR